MTNLKYDVEGDDGKPAVLLLNGGMMTFPGWKPVAAELRDDFRIVRFDFRGQLLSPGPAPRRLEEHASDVVRLLDDLDVDSVHLLGTSFGSLVATIVAAVAPARTRSLAAVTSALRSDAAWTASTRETRRITAACAAGGDRQLFHERLLESIYAPDYLRENAAELERRRAGVDLLPVHWFEHLDGILESVEDFDLSAWALQVECPSVVLTAAHDTVMPEGSGEALAALLPGATGRGAEIVEHPTSGHGLVVEDPAWLGRTCAAFFRSVD